MQNTRNELAMKFIEDCRKEGFSDKYREDDLKNMILNNDQSLLTLRLRFVEDLYEEKTGTVVEILKRIKERIEALCEQVISDYEASLGETEEYLIDCPVCTEKMNKIYKRVWTDTILIKKEQK